MFMSNRYLFSALLICYNSCWAIRGEEKVSKNILMYPLDHGSNVNNFVTLANGLSAEGHNVLFLATKRFSPVLSKLYPNVTIFYERKGVDLEELVEVKVNEKLQNPREDDGLLDYYDMLRSALGKLKQQAISYITEEELQPLIAKCDLAIMDGADIFKASLVIPYKYNIPYVLITPQTHPWLHSLPIIPSAEPSFPATYLSPEGHFMERLKTLITYIVIGPVMQLMIEHVQGDVVGQFAPERPHKTVSQLYLESEMIFILQGLPCVDYPRTSNSHYRTIGSLAATSTAFTPSETLDPYLKFIGQSPFVVMTLGSAIKTIPEKTLSIILETFSEFKQWKFVMRNSVIPDSLPGNVKVDTWIPQNDLMAHENVSLFVTHGGNNGLMEAAYHGVPTLVLAVFGDQFQNAKRAKLLGSSEYLDFFSLTQAELSATLNQMLGNDSYAWKAKKCSRVLQEMPSGLEVTQFWINHILQFGAEHLKPLSLKWPLYKLLSLDILAALVVLSFVSLKMMALFMKLLRRCCCKKRQKEKHE